MTSNNELKNYIIKQFFGKKLCRCFWGLYDCKKEAIRAHSIQNKKVIEDLSRNGRVIMPQIKVDFEKGPKIIFKEVGRNKATTFTGLCSHHDNEIFKPIDDEEIDFTNKEHLFLLSYRSVYKEVHAASKAAIDVQSGYLKGVDIEKYNPDSIDPLMMFAIQQFIAAHSIHMYKLHCDQIYIRKDWKQVEHKYYILDNEKPMLAVSSIFSSDLYSEATKGLSFLALNVFPQDRKTHIVFSYLIDHRNLVQHVISRFVFANKNYFMHELSKMIIRKCENFIMSPDLFETFTKEQVRALEKYIALTIFDHSVNLDDPKIFLFGPV